MNSGELLRQYDAIWQLTQKMLEAANQGEWDPLVELVRERAMQTEALMKKDRADLWNPEAQGQKADLIRQVIAADEEIKALTEAWMVELQEMLGSISTEKKLQQTYETP